MDGLDQVARSRTYGQGVRQDSLSHDFRYPRKSPMNSPGSEPPAAELAASLARTLAGLRDPSVQVGWVRSQLEEFGAARAADVLTVVLARAQQREEPYSTLLLRVSLALSPENALPF